MNTFGSIPQEYPVTNSDLNSSEEYSIFRNIGITQSQNQFPFMQNLAKPQTTANDPFDYYQNDKLADEMLGKPNTKIYESIEPSIRYSKGNLNEFQIQNQILNQKETAMNFPTYFAGNNANEYNNIGNNNNYNNIQTNFEEYQTKQNPQTENIYSFIPNIGNPVQSQIITQNENIQNYIPTFNQNNNQTTSNLIPFTEPVKTQIIGERTQIEPTYNFVSNNTKIMPNIITYKEPVIEKNITKIEQIPNQFPEFETNYTQKIPNMITFKEPIKAKVIEKPPIYEQTINPAYNLNQNDNQVMPNPVKIKEPVYSEIINNTQINQPPPMQALPYEMDISQKELQSPDIININSSSFQEYNVTNNINPIGEDINITVDAPQMSKVPDIETILASTSIPKPVVQPPKPIIVKVPKIKKIPVPKIKKVYVPSNQKIYIKRTNTVTPDVSKRMGLSSKYSQISYSPKIDRKVMPQYVPYKQYSTRTRFIPKKTVVPSVSQPVLVQIPSQTNYSQVSTVPNIISVSSQPNFPQYQTNTNLVQVPIQPVILQSPVQQSFMPMNNYSSKTYKARRL